MSRSDSGMAYAIVIYVSSTLSLLTNVSLLALFLRFRLKAMKSYKYFFAVMAVHDVAMSASMILCVPRGHHGENYFIYVSTGIIHSWERGEAVLMLFWFVMSSSVIILMNSFVYRYVHICRPDLSYLYSSRRWILLIWVLNVLLLSNCAFLLVMTSIPKEIFRRQVYGDLTSLDGNAFIGISLEHRANELSGFLVADSAMIMLLLSITGIFCAVRIHLTVKHTGMSPHVKQLQRQMFRVLLFQTVCPTLFLYFPSCVIYAILFGNLRHGPLVTDFLGILTSLYSLFNPLVTMFSISDYRRYVLSLLRFTKSPHQAQSVVSYTNRIGVIVSDRSAI